jgi:methyl-accepting chemotaxis protein
VGYLEKLSLKLKLTFSFILIGIIPVIIISIFTWSNNTETLTKGNKDKLDALNGSKAEQIENLFQVIKSQILTMSSTKSTVEAMKLFKENFNKHSQEANPVELSEIKKSLTNYYTNEFKKEFLTKNKQITVEPASYIDSFSSNTLSLQYSYISNNENELGNKDKLYNAKDNSSWSKTHNDYHKTFHDFLNAFGYYDIFLVDHKTGDIVYSVFKEVDFATSLLTGPYKDTNFATAFKMAAASNEVGKSFIVDLDTYFPSYEFPAGFIATPIFDGEEKIGVLVFQIPIDKINAITTSQKRWKQMGYGDSGETYIVGKDMKMRSDSRFLIETPDDFFTAIKDLTTITAEDTDYMKMKQTTSLKMTVDSQAVKDVIATDKVGFNIVNDYRKVPVLSSYQPLRIDGLQWYLFSEKDESEVLISIQYLTKIVFAVLAVAFIVVLILSHFISNKLSSAMLEIAKHLRSSCIELNEKSNLLSDSSKDVSSRAKDAADAIQHMVSSLDEINSMVSTSATNSKEALKNSQNSEAVAKEGKNNIDTMIRTINEISSNNDDMAKSMHTNNEEMSNIVNMITEISTKTQVINDIVFQTKLLSFNASVEAARAGEHGKGFAVVAEEVGNLATMSGEAAKEIEELLQTSTQQVESIVNDSKVRVDKMVQSSKQRIDTGVDVANKCGVTLDQLVNNSSEVKNLVDEVTQACSEQSIGVNEVTKAMNKLDETTHLNTKASQVTSHLSENLSEISENTESLVINMEQVVLGNKG